MTHIDAGAASDEGSPPGRGHSGAEVLVQTLADAGVSRVFGIPGEHCLAITDALDRNDSIRFVSVRHESSAAFMAEALGKLTGVPAACLGTASVGASNLVAGVNVAHHDSTPMVTIVGQVATNMRGRDAWQEVDLVSIFAPICRYAVEPGNPETLPEVASRAISLATVNRPGPVLLSVPVDLQEGEVPAPRPAATRPRGPAPSAAGVREVVEMLRDSWRPLLVVGGGIRASGARDELVRLAEQVGLPVVTGFRRTDAFPNDSEHYVGALGLSASDNVRDAVLSADLLIVVGSRLSELTTLRYSFPTTEQRTVHIDVDASTLATQSSPAEISLVSDARHALGDLREECVRAGVSATDTWWRSHRSASAAEVLSGASLDRARQTTREIASVIDRLLPEDGIVTSDAGDFFLDCAPVIELRAQRRFLGPTSGTMGYGLPAAIAAKSAAPDRVCVALCGDGGVMMSIQELETAVRYGLGVVVVVFNNFAYGSIVRHQARRFGGNSVGTNLGNPSFAGLADLFGGTGHLVETPGEFATAFGAAVDSDGVDLIEVRS